jgi:ribosome-associated protein
MHKDNSDDENNQPAGWVSKTSIKKQMTVLQKLGEELVNLPDAEYAKITLESPLAQEVAHARTLTSHGARRRQLQYIGKIMRNIDAEVISTTLNNIQQKGQIKNVQFQLAENWRERLLQGGDDSLHEFLQTFVQVDRQQLRQLIRNVKSDVEKNKKTDAATVLFRFVLHEIENK